MSSELVADDHFNLFLPNFKAGLKELAGIEQSKIPVNPILIEAVRAVTASMELPIEIRQQVCGYLDQSDLMTVRLVCRELKDASTRYLFRHVYLKPNMDSFSKLQVIAAHPVYSMTVKALTYSMEMLGDGEENPQNREGWYRKIGPADGHYLTKKGKDRFMKKFTSSQLDHHYQRYCERIHSEKLFMKYNLEENYLVNAFQGLLTLNEINFGTERSKSPHYLDNKIQVYWDSFSTTGRQTLVEPSDHRGYDCAVQRFTALNLALSKVGKRPEIFRAYRMPQDALRQSADMIGTMSNCRQFSIKMDFSNHGIPEQTIILPLLIAGAPYLQTLELSFDDILWNDPSAYPNLSQLIEFRHHWPNLKRLKLQALNCTEEALTAFLTLHATTLRVLTLKHIDFVEDLENTNGHRDSWVGMILFLEKALSLEKVRFAGILATPWDEAWYIHDPSHSTYWYKIGKEPPPVGSCLKHRLERFVVEGGQFPFPMPIPGMRGQYRYSGDNSWEFYD